MLRDMMVNEIVGVDATYTADADFATGLCVVKDLANKLAKLPAADTGVDVVFVQKARIPTGCNASKTYFSDYNVEFNTVAEGDKVVLYNYAYDNIFATDQFDATSLVDANVGKFVVWGTDGKAKVATAGTDSLYKFIGLYNDAGHTLARFYKVETVGSN